MVAGGDDNEEAGAGSRANTVGRAASEAQIGSERQILHLK